MDIKIKIAPRPFTVGALYVSAGYQNKNGIFFFKLNFPNVSYHSIYIIVKGHDLIPGRVIW